MEKNLNKGKVLVKNMTGERGRMSQEEGGKRCKRSTTADVSGHRNNAGHTSLLRRARGGSALMSMDVYEKRQTTVTAEGGKSTVDERDIADSRRGRWSVCACV